MKTLAVNERYVLGTARFMEIPTKDLFVDDKYQRALNSAQIKRMFGNFKVDLFETPTVNDRSGWAGYHGKRFALIDGQHRWHVAKLLKMPTMTCRLVAVSPQEEAVLFVELNRQRQWVTPVMAFKAELHAGNPAAREINACLAERGLVVANPHFKSGHASFNVVACVAAMKRIYAQTGYAGLSRVVDLSLATWPAEDTQRFSGQVFLAIHTFFIKNKSKKVDIERLSVKLSNVTARYLIAKGTARWHAWQGLGEGGKGSVVDAIADEIGKTYRKR